MFNDAASDDEPVSLERQNTTWEDIKARERVAAATDAGSGVPDAAPESPIATATSSSMDGVPLALPALMRASKLSKRAARVGFDFERAADSAHKVAEELAEVLEAAAADAGLTHAAGVAEEREAPGADAGFAHAAEADAGPTHAAGVADAAGAHATKLGAQRGPSRAIVEEVGDLLFAVANLARKLEVDAEAALRAANAKFERRFRGMERLAAQRGLCFDALDLVAQEALWQEVKRGERGERGARGE
jgi:uncharacterized protein YabN with tetrapyrrole methylase and pyrophosphatase domain